MAKFEPVTRRNTLTPGPAPSIAPAAFEAPALAPEPAEAPEPAVKPEVTSTPTPAKTVSTTKARTTGKAATSKKAPTKVAVPAAPARPGGGKGAKSVVAPGEKTSPKTAMLPESLIASLDMARVMFNARNPEHVSAYGRVTDSALISGLLMLGLKHHESDEDFLGMLPMDGRRARHLTEAQPVEAPDGDSSEGS